MFSSLSLIQDQVRHLVHDFDVPAAYLSSAQTATEARGARGDAQGTSDVSPGVRHAGEISQERALWSCLEDLRERAADAVRGGRGALRELGCHFLLDYKKLGDLKKHFPDVPMTALTATATPEVRADVLKTLGIKNARGFVVTLNCPNIEMTVKSKKSYRDASKLGRPAGRHAIKSGIVDGFSYDETEQLAAAINDERKRRARERLSGAGGGGVQRGHVDVGSCRVSKRVDALPRGGVLRHHRRDGYR